MLTVLKKEDRNLAKLFDNEIMKDFISELDSSFANMDIFDYEWSVLLDYLKQYSIHK